MAGKNEISRRRFISAAGLTACAAALGSGFSLTACMNAPNDSGKSSGSDQPFSAQEGEWIPTSCNMCFCCCAVLVRVVDGVAVEIKGNPDSATGGGRICAKGAAGIMQLYDPNRITKPLKRTNPNKGIGEDPGWEEITWEECWELAAKNLLAGAAEGTLATSTMITNLALSYQAFYLELAMGGSIQAANSDICGAGCHSNIDFLTGTGNGAPDYEYCKYVIQFGTQAGTATRHGFNMAAKPFADARANGCKLVNFDPHMSAGAEKADSWYPILPGTDAVVALAIANVLVNELGIYDIEYLKERTNAPSLVDPDTQRVLREPKQNKALYWDELTSMPSSWDTVAQPALEGTFVVDGKEYVTAFSIYREHIKQYTPEYAEEVSGIPAGDIRTVAKEFGEAACIGQTIEIDGYTLPYRPVAVDSFSGVSRHKHTFLTHGAIMQLNVIVGSMNNVGGYIGFGPACDGYTDEGYIHWRPTLWEEDGLITYTNLISPVSGNISYYDVIRNQIAVPTAKDMMSLQPMAMDPHFYWMSQADPSHFANLNFRPSEYLFVIAANPLKWWCNFDEQAEILKGYKFVMGIDIYLSDSTYFYDLVIPEACYLERYEIMQSFWLAHRDMGGLINPWCFNIRQPVVAARDECPGGSETLANIAYACGPEVNAAYVTLMNASYMVKEEYAAPTDQKLDVERFIDSVFKSIIDEEHGVEWFKENGCYKYPRKVDEAYIWANGDPGRIPLYFDILLEAKDKIDAIVEEYDFPWETNDFQPLFDYKPCEHGKITDPEYDMMPIYYTNAVNTDTWQVENGYLNELNEEDPYGYTLEINAATAASKGISDGDHIRLVAMDGKNVEGIAALSEAIHPECIAALGGHYGTTSQYLPLAKGKGTPIVDLIAGFDQSRYDHTCAGLDQCIRVKVEKL